MEHEGESWRDTITELHVNRQNNPPLAGLGPLRLGKAKANKKESRS